MKPGAVLISTVEPFQRSGNAVARAAVNAGTRYVDSTGKLGFVLDLQKQLDTWAQEQGSLLLLTFGDDHVPGPRFSRGTTVKQHNASEVRGFRVRSHRRSVFLATVIPPHQPTR